MSSDFWVSEQAEWLRNNAGEDAILVSYVSDTMLQVVVTFPAKYADESLGAWAFALAIDQAAVVIEEETGSPFRAFVLAFTAAWEMRKAMKTHHRKGKPA